MQGRTFFRIMLENLFVNNALCKALSALVNFCNEQSYYGKKELKFFKNVPLNKLEEDKSYKTKFIFKNNQKLGVDYK